jgi:hypothetical protein
MVTVGKGLGLVILLAICGVFAYVTRRGTASREELDLNPFHPGTAAHAQWSLRRPDRLLARREAARYFPKDATAAAAYAVASHLGQLGLRRLSDDQLVTRLAIMRDLLSEVDEPTCASWVRGTTNATHQTEIIRSVETLSVDLQVAYVDITYAAMKAEVEGSPPVRRPPGSQATDAIGSVFSNVPHADHFLGILGNPMANTDGDVCAAGILLLALAAEAPPTERARVALALVQE